MIVCNGEWRYISGRLARNATFPESRAGIDVLPARVLEVIVFPYWIKYTNGIMHKIVTGKVILKEVSMVFVKASFLLILLRMPFYSRTLCENFRNIL